MPETTVLFFSALSIFFLMKYSQTNKNKYLLLMGGAGFLSAFAKWPGIFTLAGAGTYLLYTKRWKILKNPFFHLAIFGPVLLCLTWIMSIPFERPSFYISEELLGYHMIFFLDKPLSQILANIAVDMVIYLPITIFALAIIGIVFSKGGRELPLFWLFGGLLFYLLFLKGIGHHHYHYLMLPPLVIFGARGTFLLSRKVASVLKRERNLILLFFSLAILLVGAAGVGYVGSHFHQKYKAYAEDMELAARYVKHNAGEEGLIAYSDAWVYFLTTSIDISRIRDLGGYGESIENLENTPKIVVLIVGNPAGKPPIQGEFILENEFEAVLDKILLLDNYRIVKGDSYFRVMVKER
jgi:hypothetical protein